MALVAWTSAERNLIAGDSYDYSTGVGGTLNMTLNAISPIEGNFDYITVDTSLYWGWPNDPQDSVSPSWVYHGVEVGMTNLTGTDHSVIQYRTQPGQAIVYQIGWDFGGTPKVVIYDSSWTKLHISAGTISNAGNQLWEVEITATNMKVWVGGVKMLDVSQSTTTPKASKFGHVVATRTGAKGANAPHWDRGLWLDSGGAKFNQRPSTYPSFSTCLPIGDDADANEWWEWIYNEETSGTAGSPTGDKSVGNWTTAALWSKVDEQFEADRKDTSGGGTDFISSPNNPVAESCELDVDSQFSAASESILVAVLCGLSGSKAGGSTVTFTIELQKGDGTPLVTTAYTNLIPGWQWKPTAYTTAALSAAEMADLIVKLTATSTGNPGVTVRVEAVVIYASVKKYTDIDEFPGGSPTNDFIELRSGDSPAYQTFEIDNTACSTTEDLDLSSATINAVRLWGQPATAGGETIGTYAAREGSTNYDSGTNQAFIQAGNYTGEKYQRVHIYEETPAGNPWSGTLLGSVTYGGLDGSFTALAIDVMYGGAGMDADIVTTRRIFIT